MINASQEPGLKVIMKIEFYKHIIDERDIDNVGKVLRSVFLTTGDVVNDFEKKFATYLSSKNAIGVTSCTAALQLSLLAWDIGDGDEVITTPLSFCSTANAILHAGATPVFVDVEEQTGNINDRLIENSITDKTKAIMPVHLYGQMCDMKKIRQIADRYGLIIIEDAAHCVEGSRDTIRVGQLGDAACFSFYATKNITSGEGGAIVTNSNEKAERLKILRLHGIDKSAADRYTKEFKHWDMKELGWKYNMDNIHAALLIGQIDRIGQLLEKRDAVWRRYEEGLHMVPGITLLKIYHDVKHARHLFTINISAAQKRDLVLRSLQEKGVGVAVNFRPIHLLDFYRTKFGYTEGDFPCAEKIGAGTISLPLYPSLRDEEIEYVIKSVKEVMRYHGE